MVSAIRGSAVGAGLAIALLADVSIAAEDARILDGHTRLGVAAGDHAVIIWPLLCGLAKARYHLLTNKPLSGLEAERIGLGCGMRPRCRGDRHRHSTWRARSRPAARQPSAGPSTRSNNWLRLAGPSFDTSLALEFLGFRLADVREGLAAARDKAPRELRALSMTSSNVSENSAFEPILGAARRELESIQLERLRWTLHHAYDNNAYYHRSFDAVGVHPDDLKTLADLRRFPFTTKADLREAYPFGFFAVPMDKIARVHASSGTTGKPTVVGYTRNDITTWSNLVARSIRAAGGRPGMKVHVGYGYGLFTGGLGAHYGAEAAGCTVIPMSGGQTEKQVQLIMDFAPEIIMMTPSYMLAILDEFRRQGIDPKSSSLRIGIFGAEPWGEGIRNEIETAFGTRCLRYLWIVGSDGPRCGAGVCTYQGRTDYLGRPFSTRGAGSGDRTDRGRRRGG